MSSFMLLTTSIVPTIFQILLMTDLHSKRCILTLPFLTIILILIKRSFHFNEILTVLHVTNLLLIQTILTIAFVAVKICLQQIGRHLISHSVLLKTTLRSRLFIIVIFIGFRFLCIFQICDSNTFYSPDDYLTAEEQLGKALMAIASVSYAFVVASLSLLVILRDKPAVRKSSVLFGVFMHAAAIVMISYSFLILGEPDIEECLQRAWVLPMGFAFFMGCLIVKTWRIHVIFSPNNLVVVKLTNSSLVEKLTILLIFEACCISAMQVLGNLDLITVVDSYDYQIKHYQCEVQDSAWLIPVVYNGLLLLSGAVLAYKTRHVQMAYNESVYS